MATWAQGGPSWAKDLERFTQRRDHYGEPLRYDPTTPKKVYSEALLILLTRRHADLINMMLRRSEHPFESLDELIEELRHDLARGASLDDIIFQLFAPSIDRPKPSDLIAPKYPFEFSMSMDPQTKRMVLPPERDYDRLDRAVEKILNPPSAP